MFLFIQPAERFAGFKKNQRKIGGCGGGVTVAVIAAYRAVIQARYNQLKVSVDESPFAIAVYGDHGFVIHPFGTDKFDVVVSVHHLAIAVIYFAKQVVLCGRVFTPNCNLFTRDTRNTVFV